VRRLGGSWPISGDVYFVAATDKDLEEAVRAGTFLEDLYCRLAGGPNHVPPPRQRTEDIPLLPTIFLKELRIRYQLGEKSVSIGALQAFREYAGPGNVREFQKLVERLVVSVQERLIGPTHISPAVLIGES
jgi:transcriptional regulator with GAF, ATPase, and Fis domain